MVTAVHSPKLDLDIDDVIAFLAVASVLFPFLVTVVNWVAFCVGFRTSATERRLKELNEKKEQALEGLKRSCAPIVSLSENKLKDLSSQYSERRDKVPAEAQARFDKSKSVMGFLFGSSPSLKEIISELDNEILQWREEMHKRIIKEKEHELNQKAAEFEPILRHLKNEIQVASKKGLVNIAREFYYASLVPFIFVTILGLFCHRILRCELDFHGIFTGRFHEEYCKCHPGLARKLTTAAPRGYASLLMFFRSDDAECHPCPGSFFVEVKTGKCFPCPEFHTTVDIAAVGADSCVCRAGFSLVKGGASMTNKCVPCDPGSAKSDAGNTFCVLCPRGKYQSEKGATECKPCPDNSASPEGSTSCQCLQGYEKNTENGKGLQCKACDLNQFKDTLSDAKCTSCPANMIIPTENRPGTAREQCKCKPKFYLSGSDECKECPPNSVKPHAGNEACSCKPGFELLNQLCSPCPPGHVKSSIGNTLCRACNKGEYQSDAASCMPCPKDSGAPAASTRCQCLQGYEKRGLTCKACDENQFKDTLSDAKCTSCPANMIIPKKYRPGTAGEQCVCKPNFYLSGYNNECKECPPNSVKPEVGNETCSCQPGFEYIDGLLCLPCSRNFYKPTAGNDMCLECPYSATADPGSTLCTCRKGFEYSEKDKECKMCQDNFYKDRISNERCKSCPDGKKTEGNGAKSKSECLDLYDNIKKGATEILKKASSTIPRVEKIQRDIKDITLTMKWVLENNGQSASNYKSIEKHLGPAKGKNVCPFANEKHYWEMVVRSDEYVELQETTSCLAIKRAFFRIRYFIDPELFERQWRTCDKEISLTAGEEVMESLKLGLKRYKCN